MARHASGEGLRGRREGLRRTDERGRALRKRVLVSQQLPALHATRLVAHLERGERLSAESAAKERARMLRVTEALHCYADTPWRAER